MTPDVIAFGEVVAVMALIGTLIVSQIGLHIKITRVGTILDRLILADWPHLSKKLDELRTEAITQVIAMTSQETRITMLEKCMAKYKQSGCEPKEPQTP